MAEVEVARIVIPVTTNADRAAKGVGNLNQKLGQADKAAKTSAKSFKALAGVGLAALALQAAKQIARLGGELIKAASDAEETANKFAVTFRGIGTEAQAAATSLAKNFGLAGDQAQKLLADTGDLLTGFGFTRDEALNLSTQVNELAVDLASFTNFSGGAEGASAALTKALLGERESIKSLGIAITEADIKRLAEEKGIVGELDRQTKAQLTLELAIRQSGNAIGDFERSSASFANQLRVAQANIRDTRVELGSAFLPIANLAVTAFNEMAKSTGGIAKSIRDFMGSTETIETISNVIGFLGGVAGTAFKILQNWWEQMKTAFAPILETVRDIMSEFQGATEGSTIVFDILATSMQVGAAVVRILGAYFQGVVRQIKEFVDIAIAAAKAFGSLKDVLTGEIRLRDLRDEFAKIGDEIVDLGRSTIEIWTGVGKQTIEEVKGFVSGVKANTEELQQTFADASASTAEFTERSLAASGESATAIVENAVAETQNLADQIPPILTEAQKAAAAIEEEYTMKLLEQSGDRITILEMERDARIAEAEAVGANTKLLEQFYANEILAIRTQLEEDTKAMKAEAFQTEIEGLSERAAANKAALLEAKAARDQAIADEIAAQQALTEEYKKELAKRQQALTSLYSSYKSLLTSFFDFQLQGVEEGSEEEKRILKEQWKLNKALAISDATIATFRAVAEALPNIPLSIIAGALGAAQIALIAAEPMPAFQMGGSFVPPGYGSDGALMRVSSGEQVDVTPARESGTTEFPRALRLSIGGRDFAVAVEDAFNKEGAQIRRSGAVRVS